MQNYGWKVNICVVLRVLINSIDRPRDIYVYLHNIGLLGAMALVTGKLYFLVKSPLVWLVDFLLDVMVAWKQTWWRHQMETFSALLALCAGNSPVPVNSPHKGQWEANMMTSSNGNIFRVTGPLCGEFTGPGEFPTQRPVTQSFDVFFDLRLNKRLSKKPLGWWFETPM